MRFNAPITISGDKLTQRIGKILYLEPTPPSKCQLCSKENTETRPYGANGEEVCFDCGMKDEKTTRKKFGEIADDAEGIIIL